MYKTLKYYQNFVLRTLCLTSLVFIAGCVHVNTVKLFQTFIDDNPQKEMLGDGIAFLKDGACIYVVDRSAQINSIVGDYYPSSKLYKIAIWVIPERKETNFSGYSFLPSKIFLRFDDGTEVTPISSQVSVFGTTWDKQETVWGEPRETIDFSNHEPKKYNGGTDKKSYVLDWMRIIVEFPKVSKTSSPLEMKIKGLFKADNQVEVSLVKFKFIEESRAVFPGRWADGTSIFDGPNEVCRKLQKSVL
jgi:hypothetical protein